MKRILALFLVFLFIGCSQLPSPECMRDMECEDNITCTKDKCVNGSCFYSSVNSCVSGDSCCPKNCNYTLDKDCEPTQEEICAEQLDKEGCEGSGCKWYNRCSEKRLNTLNKSICLTNDSICNYSCVPGECGALCADSSLCPVYECSDSQLKLDYVCSDCVCNATTLYYCNNETHFECVERDCGGETYICVQNNSKWGWITKPNRWYVHNSKGKPGNCGISWEDAFVDIQTGLEVMSPGDVLNVRGGTRIDPFTAGGVIQPILSGSKSNPTKILSDDKSHIDCMDYMSDAFRFVSSENVVVQGFSLERCGHGFILLSSESVNVLNNEVFDCDHSGISLIESKDCLIEKNIVSDIHGVAHIFLDESSNNNVTKNFAGGGDSDGIEVRTSDYNYIVDNDVEETSYGISVKMGSERNILMQNRVMQASLGLWLGDAEDTIVENNIICYGTGESEDIAVTTSYSNKGDHNTCDSTYHWNDDGTQNCTYPCD